MKGFCTCGCTRELSGLKPYSQVQIARHPDNKAGNCQGLGASFGKGIGVDIANGLDVGCGEGICAGVGNGVGAVIGYGIEWRMTPNKETK